MLAAPGKTQAIAVGLRRRGFSASRGNPHPTYFPPILIGIVAYLLWKRGLAKGTYKDPGVGPSPISADG
jgi:hypothetical protein